MKESLNKKTVVRIAGAFIAWVIGSGFATGQEVLQFFSSFGYMSYAVVGINLVGFILLGYLLMRTGFENKEKAGFDHFKYFCGNKLGNAYSWLISVTLLLLISVLVSGGGATLKEYYGIPKAIGSAIVVGLVLTVYLIGFERMVSIISKIGPVIVLFSLAVGCVSLVCDLGKWEQIAAFKDTLKEFRAAPNWWLSGFLYLGLNFFPGSTYFTKLGYSAQSKKELTAGAILGGTVLILSITIMSTAIMLNGDSAAGLDIPVLYLANKISGVFGMFFSVTLILGIFSSCSVMMWSVCGRFAADRKKNLIVSVSVAIFGYVVSLFSFGSLLGTVYPIIGYIGLMFLACVLWKGIGKGKSLSP